MNKNFGRDITDEMGLITQFLDIVGIILISVLAHRVYLHSFNFTTEYIYSFFTTAILLIVIFPTFSIYLSWRGKSKIKRARQITFAWILISIILIYLSALFKMTAAYSRIWFFLWVTTSLIYLVGYRHIIDIVLNKLRKKGWNNKNIIIFGAGSLGQMTAKQIIKEDWMGFNLFGFIDDDQELKNQSILNKNIYKSSEMEKLIIENEIKELWITIPLRNELRVKEILYQLRHLSISINYIPNIFSFRLLNQKVSEIAGIPILQLNGSPIFGVNKFFKELEDKIISAIIIILISPVLILIAIAIKLESKGPILFKQLRNGWDGKIIKVYKFRSMTVMESEGDFNQVKKNDTRITKVGSFIRKTSLDELPQFLNVLQGRMSIVGPRPHAIAQNEEFKDQVEYYMQRHRVKPGITGWAQINGFRGETDTIEKMSKRVEYDLYYIENWSIGFDLKIILLTIFKGFINKNAY